MIDRILNKVNMYQLVLISLLVYILTGAIFAALDVISLSAGGLLLSVLILVVSCFATNQVLSRTLNITPNRESWLISALILVCIAPPPDSLARGLAIAGAGVVAIASKYLITWRGAHIVNPAAFGILVFSLAGVLPATWWIGSPPLLPFVVIGGLLILRKNSNFQLFGLFAITSLITLVVYSLVNGTDVPQTLTNAILSFPLIFLGTIMLTEPATMPARHYTRNLFAVLVGFLFAAEFHFGPIFSSPQLALVAGNVLAFSLGSRQSFRLQHLSTTKLSPSLFSFKFKVPMGKRLLYIPGQYAQWTLPDNYKDAKGNRRMFTIASSLQDNYLELITRITDQPSDYKKGLLALDSKSPVHLSQVTGDFVVPEDTDTKLTFIAGGVGITPFISMLKSYEKYDIELFHYIHDESDKIMQQVIRSQAKTTYLAYGDSIKVKKDRLYFVSGSSRMVDQTVAMLRKKGVSSKMIKTDHFSGY